MINSDFRDDEDIMYIIKNKLLNFFHKYEKVTFNIDQ